MHGFQIKLVEILKTLVLQFESLQTLIPVATEYPVATEVADTCRLKPVQNDPWTEGLDDKNVDEGNDLNESPWFDFGANNSLCSIGQGSSTPLKDDGKSSCDSRCDTPQVHLEDIEETPLDIPPSLNEAKPPSLKPVSLSQLEDGTFRCELCSKTFSYKYSALRHHKKHTGVEKLFCCDHCDKKFHLKASLNSHLLLKHNLNSDAALTCPTCGKVFARRFALNQHLVIHQSEKPFQCDLCGKTFTQKVSRDLHVLRHTGECNFKCSVCSKRFVNKSKLNAHEYKHKEPRFCCHVCGAKFYLNESLRTHMKLHDDTKPYSCTLCSKTFTKKSNFDRHEQTHQNVRFTCSVCSASFSYKSSLTAHSKIHGESVVVKKRKALKKTVKQEEHFLCSTCGKEFKKKYTLKQHEKQHRRLPGSESEKPFSCHFCPKKYSQNVKLKYHFKTHFEDAPHSCTVCGRSFYRKDVYERHMTIHSGRRQFSCAHCGKAFMFKHNLSVHMATHGMGGESQLLVCDACGKKFKHKSSYNIHRKSHAGEFNHICVTCGKKFIKKSHFDDHLRSHQTDRPFTCPTCGKDYKEKKHCRQHIKRMHPNEFNLDSLFASITAEDAQMASLLCSEEAEKLVLEQHGEPAHMGMQQDHQSVSIVSQSTTLHHIPSVNMESGLMLDQPQLLLLDTVQSSNLQMFTSSPFSLEPILPDVHLTQPSDFLSHPLNTHSLATPASALQCPVSMVGDQVPLVVLSGEDTTSVLSQS